MSGVVQIVIATHNAGKLRELQEILRASISGLKAEDVVTAVAYGCDEVEETAVNFAGNALLKARSVAHQTARIAVADDSGLAVGILGGAPGIFSSRWAGIRESKNVDRDRLNYELLLAQLQDIDVKHRQAEFICAAAVVHPDGHEHVEYGRMSGVLLPAAQGKGGFGYDPIFCPFGQDGEPMRNSQNKLCSNAELTREQKNKLSHRGQAFRRLAPVVKQYWQTEVGR